MAEPDMEIWSNVDGERIKLTVYNPNDGSLVISDGHGVQLITLNMRRAPALISAFQGLADYLAGRRVSGANRDPQIWTTSGEPLPGLYVQTEDGAVRWIGVVELARLVAASGLDLPLLQPVAEAGAS